jgi:protocatechuate 3,4-dioxygenase beta subunit
MTRLTLALLLLVQAAEHTAEIRGRVTDKETGRPLPYAQVSVAERTLNVHRTVLTDDAGLYRLPGLPAGTYDGIVTPGPYRSAYEFQPLVAFVESRSIELAKGAVREINVALPRTASVPVRVVDEFGIPVSEVGLAVYRWPAIDRTGSSIQHRTDDRGRMRITGLRPGRYVICTNTFATGSTEGARNAVRERLLRTCHPSAAGEAEAEPITVGTGEGDEIEIRMRRGRTFTVSGLVLDAAGAPAIGAQVDLNTYSAGSSSGSGGFSVRQDGRFRIANVAPGAYGLQVSIGGPNRPAERRAHEAAFVPIRLADADLDDLIVTLTRAVDVPGRIVLDDPTRELPKAQGSGFMVTARLAGDFLPGSGSAISAHARTDRTFTLPEVFGPRTLAFRNVPIGWYVKSVRWRGNEAIDRPIDFARGTASDSVEVVLSSRGATVTGRVADDRGNPVRGAYVWLLRADGDSVTDAAIAEVTSATGEFRFGPLREGEYVALAFGSRVRPLERDDRARAARLAALGERVRLSEFEERAIDLRVIKDEPR